MGFWWNRRKTELVRTTVSHTFRTLNSARPRTVTRQLRHNAFILYRVERVELVYIHEFHSKFPSPQRPHTCVAFAPTLLPGFVSCHRFRFAKALRVLQVWENFTREFRNSFASSQAFIERNRGLVNQTSRNFPRWTLPRSLNILLEIIYESCKD